MGKPRSQPHARYRGRLALSAILPILILGGCAFGKFKPCTNGGEPAREVPTGGTRQCVTQMGPNGKPQMHGGYREWYLNGKLAVEGEYFEGRKHGKWTEWDEEGKKLSERYFEHGNPSTRFDTPKKSIVTGETLPETPKAQ